MGDFQEKKQWLQSPSVYKTLSKMNRGIEREALRVTPEGRIAQTPHPKQLGSALCHNSITTDYSEALLELITQPHTSIDLCLQELNHLHNYVHHNLDNELLWPLSMPPYIIDDQDIPIAYYGDSLIGKMKHIYRRGLEIRYGRKMQSIAGIHYNLSFPNKFWQQYQQRYQPKSTLQDCKNQAYFELVQSFLHNGWILTLMTGASPMCHASFITADTALNLCLESQQDYYTAPYGCSLRMGSIGYQNAKQSELFICYDNLEQYIHTLSQALLLPCKQYQTAGLYDANGEQQQLSTSMLQIENEFYGSIRPKQVAQSLERPTLALERRGVDYVEIRNIDIDPNEKTGISKITAAIIEIFVTSCLLNTADTMQTLNLNHPSIQNEQIATNGRNPNTSHIKCALNYWQSLESIANILDQANHTTLYSRAYQQGLTQLQNPAKLPSAQILHTLNNHTFNNKHDTSFTHYTHYAMTIAQQQYHTFMQNPLHEKIQAALSTQAQKSHQDYAKHPAASNAELHAMLKEYFKNM